jgi:hypothetical protein
MIASQLDASMEKQERITVFLAVRYGIQVKKINASAV